MTQSIYVAVDPSDVDVVLPEPSGYPEEKAKQDTPAAMRSAFGETARDFPASWLVPRSEWKDRAAENDRLGLWAENRWDRFTNQSPTHECTCHALVAVAEAAWMAGQPLNFGGPVAGQRLELSGVTQSISVWFSQNSVYAQANPGKWGGASCQQVIGIACDRGFLPDLIQPKPYSFRHTMWGTCGKGGVNQSRSDTWPGWSSNTFIRHPDSWADSNWRETAKHFRPLECVNPENEEQYVSLLLHGRAIGIGRSGHSVPVGRIVWDTSGRMLFRYKDSYDRFLYDSRAYTSGAYSILTMTQPDDWNKPAG